MDNVACTGRYWLESKLTDCPFDTHTADCTHSQDAGVYCQTECEMDTTLYTIYNTHCNSLTLTLSLVACQSGSVRLSYSTVPLQGTLEICSNETWHTLCDRCWDNNDAAVVCHQLGYSRIGTQTKINTWLLPLILTIRPQFINFKFLIRHFPCTQCTSWYYHCSPWSSCHPVSEFLSWEISASASYG